MKQFCDDSRTRRIISWSWNKRREVYFDTIQLELGKLEAGEAHVG